MLDRLLAGVDVGHVNVPPLSEAGTRRLVRSLIADAHESYVAGCHRASGGNPFLVVELVRAATAEGIAPSEADADKISEVGAAAISRAVLVPLGRLGRAAVRLARAAAVMGSGSRLEHVAEVAGLDARARRPPSTPWPPRACSPRSIPSS